MRDIKLEDTFYHNFSSRAFATGIPTVLSGTPALSVIEENNATPITAGVSVDVDRASVVGLNQATIVATTGNGYEAGKSYAIYISTGTVGGVSVVGEVVGSFTVQAAPVNWARVTAPTTAVDLTQTDIQLVDTVTTYTGNTKQTGDNFALIGTAGVGLTNVKLPEDGLDLILKTSTHTLAIADAVWDEAQADHVAAGSFGIIASEIAAIPTTEMRGTDSAATAANVATALTDIHLDHLLAVDYDPASKPGTSTALFNELVEDDGGVSRYTVNALENAPSGTGASAATIAAAVWDAVQSSHVTVGSFGIIASEIAAIPTTMRGTDSAYTGTPPTAAAITSAVWDKAQSSHTTADTMGAMATELALIPTTMVGTDNAALASVCTETRLAELDAAKMPADVDTINTATAAVQVTTDKFVFTTANQVDSNALAINSTTAAAVRLALSAGQIIPATVDTATNSHTPTTTEFQADDITTAAADHYNGRIVVFTSGTLTGQATDITDYVVVGGIGQFTVTALTSAPLNDVAFLIV